MVRAYQLFQLFIMMLYLRNVWLTASRFNSQISWSIFVVLHYCRYLLQNILLTRLISLWRISFRMILLNLPPLSLSVYFCKYALIRCQWVEQDISLLDTNHTRLLTNTHLYGSCSTQELFLEMIIIYAGICTTKREK